MANRTVFKGAGSFGPAGAIAILAEKICRAVFYDAYEQNDPNKEQSEKWDKKAREERSDYVGEVFSIKGRLCRELKSFKSEVREAAYDELAELIKKHTRIISRTEKTKLFRMRQFYVAGSAEYRRCIEQSKHVDEDTLDNLTKMALHIVKDAQQSELMSRLDGLQQAAGGDIEDGDIRERVPEARAEYLLEAWKKILYEHEKSGGANIENTEENPIRQSLLNNDENQSELEQLKDKLFIATGEDTQDTFLAFETYGLNPTLTAEDRRRLAA